ncbi:MAG: hypothetical protein EOP38_03705 [Rubrivivax sp.]|nr:MAG: hypothetical protein EOP38_03705 [Rubrivivax sp.]
MSVMKHRPRVHGRTLVELMIAMVLSLAVLSAVLYTASNTSSSGRRTDALGRLTENGQVALQIMAKDLRMAGYSMPRAIFAPGYLTNNYAVAGIRGCDNGFGTTGVGSASASTLGGLTCTASAAANTDSAAVAITYETDLFNTIPVGTGTQTPSDCRGNGLVADSGQTRNATSQARGVDADKAAYWRVENRYYIAQTADQSGTSEFSLFCTGNGGDPTATGSDARFGAGVALVRGVQRMVATYGVGTGVTLADGSTAVLNVQPDAVQYLTAAAIDAAWPTESVDKRWQRVVAVRMCLEIMGDAGSAESGTTYLPCPNGNTPATAVTITDGRQRRIVTLTMNLRNRTSIQSQLGFGGV